MVHYLETNSLDPCFNLAFEEYVLETRRDGDWLMLWQDAPSVIIGLNQLAAAEVDGEYARGHGIAVVRRATGGGAVYHDAGNMNYSIFGDAGDAASLSLSRFMEPVCRGHGQERYNRQRSQGLGHGSAAERGAHTAPRHAAL